MNKLKSNAKLFDVFKWVMDWDITLKDGTKCKVKDNVKSVTFKQTKKLNNV